MELRDAIAAFLDFRRDEGRDVETVTQYAGHLGRWAAWRDAQRCDPAARAVTGEEVAGFFRHLAHEAVVDRGARRGQQGYAPSTLRAYHRTCSTFWRWLRRRRDAVGAYILPPAAAFVFERGSVPIPPSPDRVRPPRRWRVRRVHNPGSTPSGLCAGACAARA